jgi:hypothetical protein
MARLVLIYFERHGRLMGGSSKRRIHMSRIALAVAAGLSLAGCGTQTGDRIASGAALGAGAGVVLGPIGAGAGALVGGAVGAFVPPDKVNLGKPVWND